MDQGGLPWGTPKLTGKESNLNISKCRCISFHRLRTPIQFDYSFDVTLIERVFKIRDLGILYDEKITFARHIECIISKAYLMIGFMIRICSEFANPVALKSVYCSHIRSLLEFGCVVWYPRHTVHIDRIESIQKKNCIVYVPNVRMV